MFFVSLEILLLTNIIAKLGNNFYFNRSFYLIVILENWENYTKCGLVLAKCYVTK